MEMEIQSEGIENVTKSELLDLELASWNRIRTDAEIESLISKREAIVASLGYELVA